MPKVRIKLASTNIENLNSVCATIKDIATKAGLLVKGPVPLPTKRLKITTRRSPCGAGTETYDRFEMRIYKRLIDMSIDERVLRALMRVPIPKNVKIQIEVKD